MITGVGTPSARQRRQRQAVLAGQHQVEHDQVEMALIEGAPRGDTFRRRLHLEALTAEIARQQIAQACVVIYQQDAFVFMGAL
jgi:hypothetical protein